MPIPAETEQLLLAYGVHYPEDEKSIERVIELRRRIGEEFDRLLGLGKMLEQ
jgi:hypothetical protein